MITAALPASAGFAVQGSWDDEVVTSQHPAPDVTA